jgi:uncharacterized protein YjbJ (UPF0337 family)
MGKVEEVKQRIVGTAKQAVVEIIGDQLLHEDGKGQAGATVIANYAASIGLVMAR